ncbi:MAG TPA: anhydro-N-acetylmuramic acid kinase [Bacteroidia bacterium]|jgi:anhydro-N-acetylmuramic acid kinase|nr:anhydro-N-acetylmuramic acid kinase [Bacteroidia bacterium]
MKEYNVIGLMSGTSLDGLDIAYCSFRFNKGRWKYAMHEPTTIKYSKEWLLKLKDAHKLIGENLVYLHNAYGEFLGKSVLSFIKKHSIKKVDLISSHGHTVFHRPELGFTFQLGNGAALAATCGITTVCDFRTLDVSLKGQGAPLVPIGDRLLFPEYSFCLNLGGFSNISYEENGDRVAFDICPVNIALNYLAALKGKDFDKGGSMAKSGKVNKELLLRLNGLSFYKKKKPKSLGREWLEKYFLPLLNANSVSVEDKLATVAEHIAQQIAGAISSAAKKGDVLITGGGGNNGFLISKLKEKLPGNRIIVPPQTLVNFKEALVFAFLGVLKMENKINTLQSVTGALRDSSGGVIIIPQVGK